MAKAKKSGGKTRARRATKRKGSAKAGRKAAGARPSAGAGASKRLAELQAENRRLRDEIAALRGELANRTGQTEDSGLGGRPPSLGL